MRPSKHSMQGRVCLVTGATSGIGKALALRLAERGATVVLVARNREKGEAVRAELQQRTGNPSIDLVLMDLSSTESIHQGVADFQRCYPRLHVLVNQAGLVQSQRTVTAEGLETMFATNYLAYFTLTNLLLPQLKAAAPARILNVTGGIEAAGSIDFDDLQGEQRFSWSRALAQSKLADVLFTYELARRLEGTGVTCNALNPGGVKTGLGKGAGGVPELFMKLGSLFFADAEKAAERFVHPLVAPELVQVSGCYFGPDGRTLAKSSARSHDEAVARRLWDVSTRLARLPVARAA
ncbi:SDR family oxidoreductase [Corallococcus llansteffanensis]|nr:SDR family oxidoreductase [Corallococcus llansteffanensis]